MGSVKFGSKKLASSEYPPGLLELGPGDCMNEGGKFGSSHGACDDSSCWCRSSASCSFWEGSPMLLLLLVVVWLCSGGGVCAALADDAGAGAGGVGCGVVSG